MKPSRESTPECCSFVEEDNDEEGEQCQHHYVVKHNPHPHRCKHICGLHGAQVPNIVDDGLPLDFHICYPVAKPEMLQAAAANPSRLGPLIKPEHLRQFQELTAASDGASKEPWRGALSKLARETFGVGGGNIKVSSGKIKDQRSGSWQDPTNVGHNPQAVREQNRIYSPLTGRLVDHGQTLAAPMTSSSGDRSAAGVSHHHQHRHADFEKIELLQGSIMGMLCRILQTSDEAAVRAWLVAASPRERTLVSDIIRSSVANKDEYFLATPPPQAFGSSRHSLKSSAAQSTKTATPAPSSTSRHSSTTPITKTPVSVGPTVVTLNCDEVAQERQQERKQQQQRQPVPPAGKWTRQQEVSGGGSPASVPQNKRRGLSKPGPTKKT